MQERRQLSSRALKISELVVTNKMSSWNLVSMPPFFSRKHTLISFLSQPCSKSSQYSRKLTKNPDLFRLSRVLTHSSAQLLSSEASLSLSVPDGWCQEMWPCRLALVSTPCCHPSTAASWPWCLLYSHDRSQPQRWKHTELSHSSNFLSGLWESGAILFPFSAEDLLVSAGEMETWRFFFPAASATSDRGCK